MLILHPQAQKKIAADLFCFFALLKRKDQESILHAANLMNIVFNVRRSIARVDHDRVGDN